MRFFYDCKNIDEAKVIYHKLAKLFHPDHGGDKEMMSTLTNQYEEFKRSGTQAEPTIFQQAFSQMNRSRYDYVHSEQAQLRLKIKSLEAEIFNLRMCCHEYQMAHDYNERHARESHKYEAEICALNRKVNDLRTTIREFPDTLWEFIKWKYFAE